MRRVIFALTVIASMVLTACQSAATETAAPTAAPTTVAAGCTVKQTFQPVGTQSNYKLPPISDADWSVGNANAPVTIVEYSDFQCPYCQQISSSLNQLTKDYPDQVRFIYRHFPLPQHDRALLGTQAAEAAGLQGKFWEMHDLLFKQENWTTWTAAGYTLDQFKSWILDQAKSISGLDVAKFTTDLISDAIVQKAKQAQQSATDAAIHSTPSLFIYFNGTLYFDPDSQVPGDYSVLSALVEYGSAKTKPFTACPPMTVDPKKTYTATIQTDKGNIVIQLFPDKAPITVNSFVFLARQGYFDNITFHRVLPGFVAQTGDPTGTGMGGPGYEFVNEIASDLKFDKEGVVAMANSGPDTNGSQFFITLAAVPQLDPDPANGKAFTIFGQVTQGMDVVQKITPRDPQPQNGLTSKLPPGDKLIKVTIEEK